ncbi:adenosylmethionine--8-amino-7-oxononanoate transaminase [Planctomycetota bacterium]
MPDYEQLQEWDKKYIWHPFTQMADWVKSDPLIVAGGEGAELIDVNGNRYIDGTASMWTNVHGHNVKELNEAITNQLDKIAHSTLLGQANEPSILLAKELIELAPRGITRVFYSDNGSTAMEIAVKMAYQYWQHSGHGDKTRFVKLNLAYHGDTVGAVSIGGVDLFHAAYRNLLFETLSAPAPYTYRCPAGNSEKECLRWALDGMRQQLAAHPGQIAAIVMEPLVQGAGGVIVHPQGFLKGARELADEFDTLLVLDEVMTGFGRCGTQWASEQEGIVPDIMATAKGLTAGYMPMAATLCREKIYEAFLGDYGEFKTFFHGHTFTGNQIGCALALANLNIYRRDNFIENLQPRIRQFHERLEKFYELPAVGDVRYCGLAAGIELVRDKKNKTPYQVSEQVGIKVCQAAQERGLAIRPLGSTLVIMPVLAIGEDIMERMLDITWESILSVTA